MSDLLEPSRDDDQATAVAEKPQRVAYRPRVRTRKPTGMTGKIPEAMVELIERKLEQGGGATIKEIGAYIQQRMGSDLAPEYGEGGVLRKQREVQERAETEAYSKQVIAYLVKTYGEPVKDGLQHEVGYGDRIEIAKGHLRKRY